MSEKIERSDTQWREQLSPEEYQVCRKRATERPFTGALLNHKGAGSYLCRCCNEELFRSETKFESGSGWPSFWEPSKAENITEIEDSSAGMRRVEVTCARCDAHLGHVFPDGPEPTGQRYCINSVALRFRDRKAE